jgi:hypothetical protein
LKNSGGIDRKSSVDGFAKGARKRKASITGQAKKASNEC